MVTQAIAQILDGSTPPFPRFTTEVSMDTFRAGHLVTISREVNTNPDFKLLRNVDEIWTLSIRKPKDFQARMLGRFVQKDIFVATEMHLRSALGSPTQYHAIAIDAASNWNSITGGIKPLRSSSNEDYLGHVFRDIDCDD